MFDIVNKLKKNLFNKYIDWDEYHDIIAKRDEEMWRKSVRDKNQIISEKLKKDMRS